MVDKDEIMDRVDSRVRLWDEYLRQSVGVSPSLARVVDALTIAIGLWALLTQGLLIQGVGFLLVLGGLFGLLTGGSD